MKKRNLTTDDALRMMRKSNGGGPSDIADYVVAIETINTTGLVTTWKVRKWKSGYCEAYGTTISTIYPMNTAYGSGYYYAASQSLPSGLFASIDYGQVNRCGGGNQGGLITASLYQLDTSTLKWYAIDTKSESVDMSFSIVVVGTWK